MSAGKRPLHPLVLDIAKTMESGEPGVGLSQEKFAAWSIRIGRHAERREICAHLAIVAGELHQAGAKLAAVHLATLALIGASAEAVRAQLVADGVDHTEARKIVETAKIREPESGLMQPSGGAGVSVGPKRRG